MKTMASILLLTAAVVSLAGCNEVDTTSRQTKTVGWFFDHRDELAGDAQGVPRQPWRTREDAQLRQRQ